MSAGHRIGHPKLSALDTKLDTKLDTLEAKLDGKLERKFNWLLSIQLASSAGILGAMARGFGWI